jgi:hypothetical protein
MREQSMSDASLCGRSVSERAHGASGESATTVRIIAFRANKQEQEATGIVGKVVQTVYVRKHIIGL